jgi:hypothetical protein
MNKTELAPGIFVYSNVIEGYDSFIPDIEEAMLSGRFDWLESYVNVNGESKKDTSIRDTYSISIPYLKSEEDTLRGYFDNSIQDILFNSFDPVEKDYSRHFSINFEDHDTYQILKYGTGQKFTNHIDDSRIHHRRISTVYYANDNYEGGEIVFPRFGLVYKPVANEMLVFPSTYVYNHSVLPVVSGTRYAIVSWIK